MSISPFGLLLGGQGTQYKGMCSELAGKYKSTSEILTLASEVLGIDVTDVLNTYSMQQLTLSDNAQPLVVTASCAFYAAFVEQYNTAPSFMCGHSLGEISALICSGALDFRDGLDFVNKRGRVMQKLVVKEFKGSVGIVLDIDQKDLENIIAEKLEGGYAVITAYNSNRQFLVAGEPSAMKTLEKHLDKKGSQLIPYRMIPMRTDAPYHSELASPLMSEIAELTDKLHINDMKVPVYSLVAGKLHEKKKIASVLVDQLKMPVLWMQTVANGVKDFRADFLVEIGPGNTMRNIIRESDGFPTCLSYDEAEDESELCGLMQKIIAWS